jgi:hypothetical protein
VTDHPDSPHRRRAPAARFTEARLVSAQRLSVNRTGTAEFARLGALVSDGYRLRSKRPPKGTAYGHQACERGGLATALGGDRLSKRQVRIAIAMLGGNLLSERQMRPRR